MKLKVSVVLILLLITITMAFADFPDVKETRFVEIDTNEMTVSVETSDNEMLTELKKQLIKNGWKIENYILDKAVKDKTVIPLDVLNTRYVLFFKAYKIPNSSYKLPKEYQKKYNLKRASPWKFSIVIVDTETKGDVIIIKGESFEEDIIERFKLYAETNFSIIE